MAEFNDNNFSERPAYDACAVDDAIAKYCSVGVSADQKAITKKSAKGLDVTKRKSAILRTLAESRIRETHIFGELEYGLYNNNL